MLWGLQEKPPAKETMGLAPLQGGWAEEVVGGSVRAPEDRVLLGALPPGLLPPAPGEDVPTSSMLVASSPHWLFWVGWLPQAGGSG